MQINVDYPSAAKRRLIIASTIIPFTIFVAWAGARGAVARMWQDAAAAWRA